MRLMKVDKITVIVPVYNVAERLEICLRSLVNQKTNTQFTYSIILIDDGSKDDSGEICDEYSVQYPDIVSTFHKKNGGVSAARNFGIDHSFSQYIAFVDPDDYVNDCYLLNLYTALVKTNSDISSCWFKEKWNSTFRKESTKGNKNIDDLQVLDTESALKKLFYQKKLEFAVWGKLIKRELFDGVRFQVGRRYEDVLVTYRLISNCKRVAIISNEDYIYWQRKSGMLNSSFNSSKLDILPIMEKLYGLVQIEYPNLVHAVACRYFAGLSNVYFQVPQNNSYSSLLWNNMKKVRRMVLFDRNALMKVRLGALSTYFGKIVTKYLYKGTQKRGNALR